MGIESAADIAAMFDADDFGTSVTYTPVVGSPIATSMIVDHGIVRVGFESSLNVPHDEAAFQNSVIATPKRGDTINDGSTVYEFVSPISDDDIISVWLIKPQ